MTDWNKIKVESKTFLAGLITVSDGPSSPHINIKAGYHDISEASITVDGLRFIDELIAALTWLRMRKVSDGWKRD